MSEELPTVVSESTVEIMGYTMRVYQLSNGKRVVNKEDVDRFFDCDPKPDGSEVAFETPSP